MLPSIQIHFVYVCQGLTCETLRASHPRWKPLVVLLICSCPCWHANAMTVRLNMPARRLWSLVDLSPSEPSCSLSSMIIHGSSFIARLLSRDEISVTIQQRTQVGATAWARGRGAGTLGRMR